MICEVPGQNNAASVQEFDSATKRKIVCVSLQEPVAQEYVTVPGSRWKQMVTIAKLKKPETSTRGRQKWNIWSLLPSTILRYWSTAVVKEMKCRSDTERCREEVFHEAYVLHSLGDHTGLSFLLGICTEREPYSLVLQFQGFGEEGFAQDFCWQIPFHSSRSFHIYPTKFIAKFTGRFLYSDSSSPPRLAMLFSK